MAKTQTKSFNLPDEVHAPPLAKLEVVRFGNMTVERMTCEPGWKWSEHVRPRVGIASCQGTHFSYVISGHFRTVMDDGRVDDLGPGDISITGPGHDAWVVGDEPCVLLDIQGVTREEQPP